MSEIKIDKLLRSRRKTVSLQITPDALLIVRAPYQTSEEFIQGFIRKKAAWIRTKQEFFLGRRPVSPRKFSPGEEYQLLGRRYVLAAADDLPKAVVFDGGSIMICQHVVGNAREHLKNWYQAQALDYLGQWVPHYAQAAGVTYKSLRISDARTLWGSCGHKGTLNFCWRLIMAPSQVVDYVIIHELMHLKERNHSRKFWTHVAGLMPDYKTQEGWLRQNGHLLVW